MNLADLILTLTSEGYSVHFAPFSIALNEMRIRVTKTKPMIQAEFIVARELLPRDREDYLCGIINQLVAKINRKESEESVK